MEESKEIQGTYTLFRVVIYISLLLEFFMYAFDPGVLDFLGGVITGLHQRLHRLSVYQFLPYSKIVTLILVIITCIGTKNKKQIEYDAKRMVFWPIIAGLLFTFLSVGFYYWDWHIHLGVLKLNVWIYVLMSIAGTILVHVALDNISKYFRNGMLKDRFNFENESFEQSTELVENKFSVNIPMRFYYQGKFRPGWINIINPFRGRRRTNRAISVKLIYWLKLNVNNLKSAIWAKQRKITENIRKGMTSGWLGTSVGNYRFCFPEFPTNLRTLNGLNSIILSQFGMCK